LCWIEIFLVDRITINEIWIIDFLYIYIYIYIYYILFRGLKQVLFLELGLTKENDNFMYILLDFVCKWNMSFVKDYKK